MEEGFLLDQARSPAYSVQRWVEGTPQPSFWMGLKIGDKKVRTVTTTRCTRCGFLESYAL
jgi:hypothetical protein